MSLLLFVAKIAVDRDTGLPLPELRGQGGTIIARGDSGTVPTIYEDQAGSLAIPGSAITINDNGFTSSFWVDDTDLPISWWDGSVEVPLESVEGVAVRLDDLEVLFDDVANDAAASAAAAQAAQAAAEAVQADAASWENIVGKPGVFPPSSHSHSADEIASGTLAPDRLGSGSRDGTKYLRDDGAWAVPSGTGGGEGASDWSELTGKPATFPPSSHSHPASQISDSSPAGRILMTSSDPTSQRNAINAGRSDVTVGGSYSGAAASATHTHTPAQVGLGNVDNTSDVNKPVSVPQATALALKADNASLASLASSALRFVDSVTGNEPRPSGAGRVVWIGGATQPVNMASGDVWWGEAA